MDEVGCQPYWLNTSRSGKNCTDVKQLQTFLDIYSVRAYASEEQIKERFGCLTPCSYIEYQVSRRNDWAFLIKYFFQIAEQPLYFQWNRKEDHIEVYIMFSRSTISVEKEIDAYSFSSFIADYGGLLGLFVGYNFLGTFEFCVALFHRLIKKWTI